MAYRARVASVDDLAIVVQQARLLADKSQRELASEVGTYQRRVTEIETGKSTVALVRVFEVLNALGVRLTAEIPEPGDG